MKKWEVLCLKFFGVTSPLGYTKTSAAILGAVAGVRSDKNFENHCYCCGL